MFGIAAQPTAPYTIYRLDPDGSGNHYTNYESIRSERSFAALPFLGVAYRLHPRFVLALGTYPIIGQGTSAKYYPAPDEFPTTIATNKAAMGLLEIGEALSIKLLDNLSIALMWRITYMTQTVNLRRRRTGHLPVYCLIGLIRTCPSWATQSRRSTDSTSTDFSSACSTDHAQAEPRIHLSK